MAVELSPISNSIYKTFQKKTTAAVNADNNFSTCCTTSYRLLKVICLLIYIYSLLPAKHILGLFNGKMFEMFNLAGTIPETK